MTPQERKELQAEGEDFLFNNLPAIVTVSLCYGIFIPIAATVVHSSAWHQSQTWHFRWQLAVVCLGIAAFTIHLITRMGTIFLDLTLLCNVELTGIISFASIFERFQIWLEIISPIMNDAFIIWRAWVIFEKQRWAMYISIGLWLTTLVYSIISLSVQAHLRPDLLFEINSMQDLMGCVYVLSSLVTNLAATLFIGRMLYSYVKFLHKNMNSHQRQSFKLRHVLYLLVDAGAAYVALQAIYLVVTSTCFHQRNSWKNSIGVVFAQSYICISFVYPALTIALIHGPLSVVEVHKTVILLQMSVPPI